MTAARNPNSSPGSPFPEARRDGLIVVDLDDEILLYDRSRHRAHRLNHMAALVWRLCDGQTSIAGLTTRLTEQTGAPVGEDLVRLALDRLSRGRLLKQSLMLSPGETGVDRRAFVRQVAVAAGLAALMPVVESIIAPTLAYAASCGMTCLNNADCVGAGSCTACRNSTDLTGKRCCLAGTAQNPCF